jgi:hypothetical protein
MKNITLDRILYILCIILITCDVLLTLPPIIYTKEFIKLSTNINNN